jgi:ubiquinone/menaquinone biosynthesis C-methylase UbiE
MTPLQTPARAHYAGVLEILQYNWHFYAASLCAVVATAALLWLRLLPPLDEKVLIAAAALSVFWSIASLLASWYIYDHIGITRWSWLPRALPSPPRQWLNIHAGLDQSTPTLAELFPKTEFTVLDIYDPTEMTEPSIARARKLHPSPYPAIPAKLDALPLRNQTRDTIFLLFAAHEIRQPSLREQFFRELARVLTPSGEILVVEHLRDWKNFLVFGPGFFHFHSRKEWIRLAREAGLSVESEIPITPFVRYFLMRKPSS